MSTPTTTAATIRGELVTLIEAITPTHTESRDIGWNWVDDVDPRGSDLRSFRILTGIAEIDPEGIYGAGDGVEVMCSLVIRTAYAGINGNELTDIITRDGLDLWGQVLHISSGGTAQTIAGFISCQGFVIPEPFNLDDDASSNFVFVDFTTELHYKAAL